MHRMNIFLIEKGSLFTAVAIACSISITWKSCFLQTREKASNISFEVRARGTFNLRYGK